MTTKATFDHAGWPVCVEAEQSVATALDQTRFGVEAIHRGDDKGRLDEAENAGVKSVPALVMSGAAFQMNHGTDLSALK